MNDTTKESSLADAADTLAEKVESSQVMIVRIERDSGETEEKKVTLRKARTKDLGTILGLIHSSFNTLGIKNVKDAVKLDLEDTNTLMQLIANMYTPIVQATSDLCTLTIEDVNDLGIDDLIDLVIRLIDINKKFFLERVLPLINKIDL